MNDFIPTFAGTKSGDLDVLSIFGTYDGTSFHSGATLSDEHQVVLLMVTVEGMSYSQTAEILAVPVGTVMLRLSRAREAFRRLIDGDESALRGAT